MANRREFITLFVLIAAVDVCCGARTAVETDSGSGVDAGTDTVTYGAVWFVMAMDRFAVYKLDEENDRCTIVGFVHPMDYETLSVELPDLWAVEFACRGYAASCDGLGVGSPSMATPSDATTAMEVAGSASWDLGMCEIDVDIVLEFTDEPEEVFQAVIETEWRGCG